MDSEYKKAWEADNTKTVKVVFSKNADPEIYQMLLNAENKSAVARELIRLALEGRHEKSV